MYWTYIALTSSGQEVTATLTGQKEDILKQLAKERLSVIEIRLNYKRFILSILPRRKLSVLSLAVFFEDFFNMLEAGMGISQIIFILKDTAKEEVLAEGLST